MYLSLPINKIIHGSALERLKELPDDSIDCCCTSPPYWSLRDYKTEGQLGLESTFYEYLDKLIEIFREVKRVTKGTIWVNIGDTYNGEKSLCGIPERFAIKMTDELGLIRRNTIIWHKRNCMPSSAKDRFTIDFEYVYMFAKKLRYYFETQYEPLNWDTEDRYRRSVFGGKKNIMSMEQKERLSIRPPMGKLEINPLGRIKRCVWTVSTKPFSGAHFAVFPPQLIEPMIKSSCPINGIVLDPFIGSGTVALVALQQFKNFIGIEINPEYIKIAQNRISPILNGIIKYIN